MCTNPRLAWFRFHKGERDITPSLFYLWSQDFNKYKDLNQSNLINFVAKTGVKSLANLFDFEHYTYVGFPVSIPCGGCDECRRAKQRDWNTRLQLEQRYSSNSYFVTLTYDDDHCPIVNGQRSVSRRDVQLFMKRLRKAYGSGIRYFGVSEYGPKTQRPHYHLILFNIKIKDLHYLYQNDAGDLIYNSKSISDLWGNGFISIGDVTDRSIAYCSKYCLKKLNGKLQVQFLNGRDPDFTFMSTRPGIGRQYLDDNIDKLLHDDSVTVRLNGSAAAVPLPRYFDKILQDAFPHEYMLNKLERIEAVDNAQKIRRSISSLSDYDNAQNRGYLASQKVRSCRVRNQKL